MAEHRSFILAHQQARRGCAEFAMQAPEGWHVTFRPPTRSLVQNALLHSLLTEISKRVEWAGKRRDVTVWKRLMTAAWLRAIQEPVELLPAIDGHGFDIIFERTSTMTVSQVSSLIEFVQAWLAEHEAKVIHD